MNDMNKTAIFSLEIDEIKRLIEANKISVSVIGIGRIGLPTALSFAKAGLTTIGVDVNEELVNKINDKNFPLKDEPGYQEIFNQVIDEQKFSENYALITVCNTVHVGKGMKMAPNANLDDGKMDIVMIKDNFSKLELLNLFPKLFTGEHIKNKKVIYKQGKCFTLNPLKDEILNIDGEIVGETPITIEVIPKAIELLN